MKYVVNFDHEVVEYSDLGIVLPDGCRLSARVWMPESAVSEPVPAILEYIPYRKRDGTTPRDAVTHPWFAGHGYACVRVDMRGSGESEGLLLDEYTAQELEDACDVIAWLAEQPWCDGNIGMMGISWGGFNGLQVAALNPPALKAIISICSTVDRYADDIHYKGGCLLIENFGWSMTMLAYSARPPDRAIVGNKWHQIWRERLTRQPLHLSTWLRHQHRDDYWKHGSVCEDYGAIKAAVLSIGGWHDGYRNTISHLVENVEAPVKGIVGPWIHKYPHIAGPAPAIGFLQEARRWWDRWLRGKDTGVEQDPAYRAYVMDSLKPKRWHPVRPGRWIAETEWPAAGISPHILHFAVNGSLSDTPVRIDAEICSPQDCGAQSGEYFPFAYSDEFPGEQSVDDDKSLCFDSPVLDLGWDIVGAPIVHFTGSSDKSTGQVAVRLCDLRPDGTSAHITFGVLNLTHRQSHETPMPLVPGEDFQVSFKLDQIAYRLPAGHRLRVAVSTAYWPFIWPSPEPMTLRLRAGWVELPLRPLATSDEWRFEAAEGSPAQRAEVMRPASYSRETIHDPNSGETITCINCDFGQARDLDIDLISGHRMTETWTILPQNPTTARGDAEWEHIGGREGALWRILARGKIHCDREYFYISAKLQCWDNNELFFEKQFDDKVGRRLV